eukprot:tig00021181_g19308.t1
MLVLTLLKLHAQALFSGCSLGPTSTVADQILDRKSAMARRAAMTSGRTLSASSFNPTMLPARLSACEVNAEWKRDVDCGSSQASKKR